MKKATVSAGFQAWKKRDYYGAIPYLTEQDILHMIRTLEKEKPIRWKGLQARIMEHLNDHHTSYFKRRNKDGLAQAFKKACPDTIAHLLRLPMTIEEKTFWAEHVRTDGSIWYLPLSTAELFYTEQEIITLLERHTFAYNADLADVDAKLKMLQEHEPSVHHNILQGQMFRTLRDAVIAFDAFVESARAEKVRTLSEWFMGIVLKIRQNASMQHAIEFFYGEPWPKTIKALENELFREASTVYENYGDILDITIKNVDYNGEEISLHYG